MPPVGFELTISVLERAKTVRALDRAATAIGKLIFKLRTPENEPGEMLIRVIVYTAMFALHG
jgi:hypothetical protein